MNRNYKRGVKKTGITREGGKWKKNRKTGKHTHKKKIMWVRETEDEGNINNRREEKQRNRNYRIKGKKQNRKTEK